MTTKAYLVSWLGKGNIVWTPLQETANGSFSIPQGAEGPIRYALDIAAQNSEMIAGVQRVIDPAMAGISAIQSTVNLTAGLVVCTVGLQIGTLIQTYRILETVKEIDRKVTLIEGKFELHFLDRSLDFFLSAHKEATGLLAPVACALESDCYNALQTLINNPDLRIPAYLQMKLQTQAKAIESWNKMLYSVIHDGSLPIISDDRLQRWVKEGDITARALPTGGYAPQHAILNVWKQVASKKEKSSKWVPDLLKTDGRPLLEKAITDEMFDRTYPVVLLARELQTSMSFAEALEEKVLKASSGQLLIKAA